jgi:hypothetical protein
VIGFAPEKNYKFHFERNDVSSLSISISKSLSAKIIPNIK